MKKSILILTTLGAVVLMLAGCSSSNGSGDSSVYNSAMANGDNAVNDQNYSEAYAYYKSANEAKNDDKSKASENQAKNLVSAQKQMNSHKFGKAKTTLNKVKDESNGNSTMKSNAKDLISDIKNIKSDRSDYSKNVKNAKTFFESGNTESAIALLKEVLNAENIRDAYYSDIYKDAVDLLLDHTGSTTTSSSSSSSSSSDTGNAANGDFDVVDRGNISASDIEKARQQLRDQGVKNVDAWSDNDIVIAIKNAAADGRSTIKESDIKQK
ncbi:hypothetical protein [Lactobacillus terrae]|uniref:hypothetical protein n=1 Tax=Lactobacillus terrae TaxID=2269374 RepID=UPI000C1B632C|nr:hypothetical protein [Lactobacillus terrae]